MAKPFGPLLVLAFAAAFAGGLSGQTRFHHAHLRAPDPAATLDFFVSRLAAAAGRMLGEDAIVTPRGSLIVSPAAELRPGQTALGHIGWTVRDIRAEYIRQLDRGTRFERPLEHLGDDVFSAYLAGPNNLAVEILAGPATGVGHLRLYSLHPQVAGEWYARYLGLKPTRPLSAEPVLVGRDTVASAAFLDAGGVSLVIFPKPAGVAELIPSEGSAVDHLAFRVDQLDAKLLDLRKSGARILEMPREIAPGVRAALIQGPDRMRVELIEER